MDFSDESTVLSLRRDDLLQDDVLCYISIGGRSLPGVTLLDDEAVSSAWVNVEKFAGESFFRITFAVVRGFAYVNRGDVVIFVFDSGESISIPFVALPVRGSLVRNYVPVSEDLMAHLVQAKLNRIVFGDTKTQDQRRFYFDGDGDDLFRWMLFKLWHSAVKSTQVLPISQPSPEL